jgi:hypothetical protein
MSTNGVRQMISNASPDQQNTSSEGILDRFVPDTVAAALIGTTPATMRRWRYEGRGPRYTKIGSSVRYSVADLEAFVAARIVETSDSGVKPKGSTAINAPNHSRLSVDL